MGDWLNYGERAYGEKYEEAVAATGYAYQTLVNAKVVAAAIESNRRRLNLHWAHHAEVAALKPADEARWLDYDEQGEDGERRTAKELRLALRAWRREEALRDEHYERRSAASTRPGRCADDAVLFLSLDPVFRFAPGGSNSSSASPTIRTCSVPGDYAMP